MGKVKLKALLIDSWETRQIIKNVTQLFTQRYANNVLAVRAELSSNYREKYGLYKSREINDFHHAHDAFLAVRNQMFDEKISGMERFNLYFTLRYCSNKIIIIIKIKANGCLMTF